MVREMSPDTRIEDMDFTVPPWDRRMSTRVKNKLQRNAVMTFGDLRSCDEAWLSAHLGVVERTIVKMKLESMGLTPGGDGSA